MAAQLAPASLQAGGAMVTSRKRCLMSLATAVAQDGGNGGNDEINDIVHGHARSGATCSTTSWRKPSSEGDDGGDETPPGRRDRAAGCHPNRKPPARQSLPAPSAGYPHSSSRREVVSRSCGDSYFMWRYRLRPPHERSSCEFSRPVRQQMDRWNCPPSTVCCQSKLTYTQIQGVAVAPISRPRLDFLPDIL